MTEKFKGVESMNDDMLFNPKKLNLPYTIFIIKPQIAAKNEVCQEIITLIEDEGFEIKFVLQRELTKQEAENLYYMHAKKDYYTKLIAYNTTGESIVMLLSHKSEDPILKLKQLIGDKTPETAKTANPNSLRAKYGESIVKNEFFCSDTQESSNKDRDVFKFPIPQKIPDLKLDSSKLSLSMLWKYLHPASLEHSDVNGRLDLFALYGPVLNRHPINRFSKVAQPIIKNYVKLFRKELINAEKERLGLPTNTEDIKLTPAQRLAQTKAHQRVRIPPNLLVDEDIIIKVWPSLTDEDRDM